MTNKKWPEPMAESNKRQREPDADLPRATSSRERLVADIDNIQPVQTSPIAIVDIGNWVRRAALRISSCLGVARSHAASTTKPSCKTRAPSRYGACAGLQADKVVQFDQACGSRTRYRRFGKPCPFGEILVLVRAFQFSPKAGANTSSPRARRRDKVSVLSSLPDLLRNSLWAILFAFQRFKPVFPQIPAHRQTIHRGVRGLEALPSSARFSTRSLDDPRHAEKQNGKGF